MFGVAHRELQFEALVQAYALDLYRYAIWLGNGPVQAEDLVQETFLRAWRALDSLTHAAAAKSWLITILRREHAREFARRGRSSPPLEAIETPLASQAGATESTFILRRALADLPAGYREPLLLQILGGYSCEEIGRLLGLRPGAVMTRLFRARNRLRRSLLANRSGRPASRDRA
jgi:RNA polymerase sigma-70 factor (ECF subfamily)